MKDVPEIDRDLYYGVSGAIKHPQAPQENKWSLRNLFFEERRGGVAAIDPPPQDGNATQPAKWRKVLRACNGREKIHGCPKG